ncbi:IS110 family RNA-guided transposase [Kineococcus esterisolvens]|uniref:IS110 family transposase n=1 Tax=unclassified Kineococcus TaxID=2621656 RepID=UPI003D7C3D0B
MLFIGDDWAEDHHDVEVVDDTGRRLSRARLPEGVEGITALHALVAAHTDHRSDGGADGGVAAGTDDVAADVVIGIETDRGAWVQALLASGYRVYAINPMSVARYRDRHSPSKAKSDAGDAHVLAEVVRLDRDHHRPIADDSPQATAIKLAARAHQGLIWERTRHLLRLRSALREFYPAALQAFTDLDAPEALELLGRAPTPAQGARLTCSVITSALRRAHRHHAQDRAVRVQQVLRVPALRQPAAVEVAYAGIVNAEVAVIAVFNAEIERLGQAVQTWMNSHHDAAVYLSQPGVGPVLAARLLGEFGDDVDRFSDARARKNYAGTSPITRASGTKRTVLARHVRNLRLADATGQWAFCALTKSTGARTYYDSLRARKMSHRAALRQLANRLVGILHGCLKSRTLYSETTAWSHLIGTAA